MVGGSRGGLNGANLAPMAKATSPQRAWIGTLLFLFLAPGLVAGFIPWLISGWRWHDWDAAWIVAVSGRLCEGLRGTDPRRDLRRAVPQLPAQRPRVAAADDAVAGVTETVAVPPKWARPVPRQVLPIRGQRQCGFRWAGLAVRRRGACRMYRRRLPWVRLTATDISWSSKPPTTNTDDGDITRRGWHTQSHRSTGSTMGA